MRWSFPEGQTPLDPQETFGLKDKRIATQSELNMLEAVNIASAELWIYSQRPNVLNFDFLLSLHKRMFGDVWSWAGTLRRTERNIGISPWDIRAAMHEAIDNAKFRWGEKQSAEEVVTYFHHRMLFIHPFPNGNGRWARRVSELHCETLSLRPPKWIEVTNDELEHFRKQYLVGLRQADLGDLSGLQKVLF